MVGSEVRLEVEDGNVMGLPRASGGDDEMRRTTASMMSKR
jgi:hypothetical protein